MSKTQLLAARQVAWLKVCNTPASELSALDSAWSAWELAVKAHDEIYYARCLRVNENPNQMNIATYPRRFKWDSSKQRRNRDSRVFTISGTAMARD